MLCAYNSMHKGQLRRIGVSDQRARAFGAICRRLCECDVDDSGLRNVKAHLGDLRARPLPCLAAGGAVPCGARRPELQARPPARAWGAGGRIPAAAAGAGGAAEPPAATASTRAAAGQGAAGPGGCPLACSSEICRWRYGAMCSTVSRIFMRCWSYKFTGPLVHRR